MMAKDLGKPIGIIIGDELEKLRQRIIANIQAAGEVATGKTIRSIFVNKRAGGGSLVFKGKMPFAVVETGRRGKLSKTIIGDPKLVKKNPEVPRGFASIIYEWMMVKGIHSDNVKPYKTNRLHKYSDQERADRTMAYFIAKKIEDFGTKLNRRGGRTDIYSEEIPKTIATIRESVIALMSVEAKNIYINKGRLIK